MLSVMINEFKTAVKILLLMLLLLGVLYTGIVTSLANIFFSWQAQGSLINVDGKIIGSQLIAQKFTEAKYFWSRPSAVDYNPMPSGASNLGSTNKELKKISSSGSGLDPHISPDSAYYQMPRIIAARKLDKIKARELEQLIQNHIEPRDLGFMGENRINILEMNLLLDKKF